MAKPKKKERAPRTESRIESVKKERLVSQTPWYSNRMHLLLVLAALFLTYLCYSPALSDKKEFTNWDDPVYVVDNTILTMPKAQPLITSTSADNIRKIFSPSNPVSLNYHPLTMLSLAYNYKWAKKDQNGAPSPYGFVFTNLLFHLLNTLLVFIFLYRLSGKKFWVGFISALLFGIHPMHVESVAWVSERKDVLYCFFFLASCITYLRWIETKKIFYIVACFALFVLSCLSKAMAVPLPLVLLLIDFYRERKFSIAVVLEKVPFFLLALWIGYMAVNIQSHEAIADFKVFTLAQRFMFASFGFMMYWAKLFLPAKLSAFYPYPALDNGNVPYIYWVAPLIAAAIALVPLIITWKKNPARFRLWLFGMGFFVVMVALVLQFVSVGAAIMADRYAYLPYTGAFFILAIYLNDYLESKKRRTVLALGGAVVALLAFTCYKRVQVWQNSETLWTDVIEKYPYVIEQEGNVVHVKEAGVDNAYKNRGNYYREHGMMDKAFEDYSVLMRARVRDAGAYANMGNFYGLKGKDAVSRGNDQLANQHFAKALEMYSEAIKIKPDNFEVYMDRGITYSIMGQHQKAIEDYTAALRINPGANALYYNRGYEELLLGQYAPAINDCNSALAAVPNDANALFCRGTAYVNTGHFAEAINDLSKAISIRFTDPGTTANAWFNLSVAYGKSGQKQQAYQAALNAKKAGYNVSEQYLKSLQ